MLTLIVLASSVVLAPTASAGPVQQPASATAVPQPATPWPPAGVVRPGGGVAAPRVVKEARARYTAKAMSAKVQGSVLLEAVVGTDGRVVEVRVKRSLDREHGLDDEAVKALKKWEFAPGTKGGAAVPVLVEVEMTFTRR